MQELSNNMRTPSGGELPVMDAGAASEAGTDSPEVHELQRELAKWQERVPKLAAALRERTQQAEKLETEIDKLRNGASPAIAGGNAGIAAREQLIDELEAKLKALNSKHQDLQGQLHARDTEISDLQQDVAAWKEKWRAVTTALDAQASLATAREEALQQLKSDIGQLNSALEENTRTLEERDHELVTLREESTSLNERNAKLFETTELANRQIESLGENLAQLRDQLRARDGGLQNTAGEVEALQRRLGSKQQELNEFKARHADYDEVVAERAKLQQQLGEVQREDGNRGQDMETLHRRIETMQEEANVLKSKIVDSEEQLAGLNSLRASEAQLRAELAQRAEEIDRLTDRMAALDALRADQESQQRMLAGKGDEVARLTESIGDRQREIQNLQERLTAEHGEVERLEQCVANADQVTNERDEERRQLSLRLSQLKERNDHLEAQLNERSNLVMGLEQEKTTRDKSTRELHDENARLSEALVKAERHASEHAEHITQLDSRLERQQEHMVKLEEELAETQEESAAVKKDGARTLAAKDKQISQLKKDLADSNTSAKGADSPNNAAHGQLVANMQNLEEQLKLRGAAAEQAEAAVRGLEVKLAEAKAVARSGSGDTESGAELLQAEVHKLEQMVRDRTEQLNKMQWQQNMTERADAANIDSDNKMLMVLNQQLTDARDGNNRLVLKIRELEAQLAKNAPPAAGDDLTAIKGIGPKVASQLFDLGIASYRQIADLEEEDLADETHVLHAFWKRVEKDEWIAQARGLVRG